MAGGINSILDIGKWALFGNQAAIQTAGSNIANVNTEGYSRRDVRFEENYSLDYNPGQLGTGVSATEVVRHFDDFIEWQYHDKSSLQSRYENLWNNLQGIDSLFNEQNSDGISAALSTFYEDWYELSNRPDSDGAREALLGHTEALLTLINNTDADLASMQSQMDLFISQSVNEANDLMDQIAALNVQINAVDIPGQNNANQLYDQRAQAVRDLAEIMDVRVVDNGGGEFKIFTKAGQTLVDGTVSFEIKFEGPRTMKKLSAGSNFDGAIQFEGREDFEYTVEVVQGGQVSNASTSATALYRVSLDGGTTWMKDENGQEMHFYARPEGGKVSVGDLNIWFNTDTDGDGVAQDLQAGDRFTIVPKDGIYWYETSTSSVNITPQITFEGNDNDRRVTGGNLAGFFHFRDFYTGRYRDKLDAFANSLAWEVNRLHSQGAGLSHFSDMTGSYAVRDTTIPLGSNSSGLEFGDRLQSGNLMVYVYDESSGVLTGSSAGASNASVFGSLDFDPSTPGIQNFDPRLHSLQDVEAAFDNTFGTYLDASIVNGRLRIQARDGYQLEFGSDSSGVLAGLGLNTYFTGYDADTLSLNSELKINYDRICAGHVNGAGEANPGDNSQALAIGSLEYTQVQVRTKFEVGSQQTLTEYYASIVSSVGADTFNAEFTYSYQKSLAEDLDERQQQVAGVNLDEEMSQLIKYQHSYRAAAKLITTADEMMQTLLGLKQ